MADRSETIIKARNGLNYLRVEFGEVTVSLNDTVTLGSFDSTVAILNAYLMKKSDGTQMTATIANNVLTVTGAGTSIDCFYMAYGYLA